MYKIIDLDTWHRREYFEHYTKVVPCTYSSVVSVDITKLYDYSKHTGLKLYPLLLHGLARVVNNTEEFRYSIVEGNLINFERLSPSYTILNDDNTFTSLWTDFDIDLNKFVQNYNTDVSQYSNLNKMSPKSNKIDVFSVSMVPWLDFSAFNLNLKNDTNYLTPIFTLGKFKKQDGKVTIPVAIQVHHAVIDGYHVAKFVDDLQNIFDNM